MNEDKATHPPILRGYEKEVCNQCLQIFTFLNAKLLGISNMYVVHFNEEFQKSPHDFDDFFFQSKILNIFFLTRMNLSLCIKEVNWVVVYKV